MISPKISSTVILAIAMAVGIFAASFEKIGPSSNSDDNDMLVRETRSIGTQSSQPQPIQLCGYRLLEAVRGICGGFVLNRRPSSYPIELEVPMSNSVDVDGNDPQYPNDAVVESNKVDVDFPDGEARVVSTAAPKKIGKVRRRQRRNIIDECCKQACTVNQLIKYCART